MWVQFSLLDILLACCKRWTALNSFCDFWERLNDKQISNSSFYCRNPKDNLGANCKIMLLA